MKNSKKIALLALSGAAAVATTVVAHDAAAKEGMEKCYGVAKAGKNSCGAKGHSCKTANHDCATKAHSCAGQSKFDNDGAEFVAVPKGLCDKLSNGSIEPSEGGNAKKGKHKKMMKKGM